MEYPSLSTPTAGSIRFNTDSSKMEIYNGDKWWEIDSSVGIILSPSLYTGIIISSKYFIKIFNSLFQDFDFSFMFFRN